MPVRLKVARTAQELDDVFQLRYRVYVEERKKFPSGGYQRQIVDRYDAVPGASNIIAYDGSRPVATMRINRDSDIGLPAEEHLNFNDLRERLRKKGESSGHMPVLVSGSMLAIEKEYRNRRNVVFAMFKMAADVMHECGATDVIGAISEETVSLYGRMGFRPLGDKEWVESIGDYLVPIHAPYDRRFAWTYGEAPGDETPFWLDNFRGKFERLLLSPGDVLFRQGEPAQHAYAVDEGWVAISRADEDENELLLANLSRGALFGELAILDEQPRSATATAISNVGLIVLERQPLLDLITCNPEKLGEFLRHFAKQVRDMDDLAMVQAFAPQTRRVEYALCKLWQSADVDRKDPNVRVAKVGVEQLAKSSQIREDEVLRVLELERSKGTLEYGRKSIRFFQAPRLEGVRGA